MEYNELINRYAMPTGTPPTVQQLMTGVQHAVRRRHQRLVVITALLGILATSPLWGIVLPTEAPTVAESVSQSLPPTATQSNALYTGHLHSARNNKINKIENAV